MMKIIARMAKLFMIMMLLGTLSCGGGGSSPVSAGSMTTVHVNLLSAKQQDAARTLQLSAPSDVRFIRVVISGSGMATIEKEIDVAGRTELVETFQVPNGPSRRFYARAVDGKGGSLYQGDILADLDGITRSVDILMGFDITGIWAFFQTPQGGVELPPDAVSFIQTGNSLAASVQDLPGFLSAAGTIIGNGIKVTYNEQACGAVETTEYRGTMSSDGQFASGTSVTTGGCLAGTETGTWRMKKGAIPPPPLQPLPVGFPTDLPLADYTVSTQVCVAGTCNSGSPFTVVNGEIRQFAQLLIDALTSAINEPLNSNCGQAGNCSCITPVINYSAWNGSFFVVTDSFDVTCGTDTTHVSIQYTVTQLQAGGGVLVR
ncbi:MAG: hypothetical protein C0402_02025 [Thermodesulfovibrio sp.]|nr:hypothetical protein [Thermodesulfovibrio sp.]